MAIANVGVRSAVGIIYRTAALAAAFTEHPRQHRGGVTTAANFASRSFYLAAVSSTEVFSLLLLLLLLSLLLSLPFRWHLAASIPNISAIIHVWRIFLPSPARASPPEQLCSFECVPNTRALIRFHSFKEHPAIFICSRICAKVQVQDSRNSSNFCQRLRSLHPVGCGRGLLK